jgi:large subunit ribosomal protein L18
MDKIRLKKKRYTRRRLSVKRKIRAVAGRMRICISRSNKGFYAQIIDDTKGCTVLGLSTLSQEFPQMKNRGNKEAAIALGKLVAGKAVQLGVKKVVFDRNGYLYHGKVKAFADAMRENGLEF